VLIKELQSLGMDVKILSNDEQEIEIKEWDDDDDHVKPPEVRLEPVQRKDS